MAILFNQFISYNGWIRRTSGFELFNGGGMHVYIVNVYSDLDGAEKRICQVVLVVSPKDNQYFETNS